MTRWDDDWDDTGHREAAEDGEPVSWGPHTPFGTEDAARIGLDRNTLEGAQLAFFSHLDGAKPAHRAIAVLFLVLLVGWPLFLTVDRILG